MEIPRGSQTAVKPQGHAARSELFRHWRSAGGQCSPQVQKEKDLAATDPLGASAASLFDLVATTMPDDNPGKLSRQEYADVVAYMMKLNGIPEGPSAFPTDADSLKKLKIVLPNR